MPELDAFAWALLVGGALCVGFAKAAMPGTGPLAVALFATALPAKESTGTLLLLLIVGDALALAIHRRHADWRDLVPLVPAVLAGLLLGAVFLHVADDAWVRRTIAAILLLVVGLTLWRRARSAPPATGGAAASAYGVAGGFTTMVANAAGPVMSMYFLAARFPMRKFLATSAWFFAAVNVTKVPFAAGLGLITAPGLLTDLLLVPAVVCGALLGRRLVERMDQTFFERAVIAITIVAAIALMF